MLADPRRRISTAADLLVLAGLLAVFAYLSKFYLSQQIDDSLDITVMSEFPRLLLNHLTTDAWFYPYAVQLQSAFDPLVLPSMVGELLHPLLGGWVFTQRAEALLLVFATALSMYFVALQTIKDRFGAVFAAASFAYADNFLMRMPSHLSLLGGFVFPLLFYALVTKRRLVAGFVLGVAYWSSPEFGLMAVVFASGYFVYELSLRRTPPARLLSDYGSAALVFIPMVAFLVPGPLGVNGSITNGLVNLFWRGQFSFVAPTTAVFPWEDSTSYLGLVTVSAAAVVLYKKRDRLNLFLAGMALASVLLSMTYVPLWPFGDIRVAARFSLLALFCLSLLGGQLFSVGLLKGPTAKRAAVCALLVLLLADNAVGPPSWFYGPAPPFQWNDPGYQVIRNDPSALAQVDFPILPTSAGLVYYQYEGVLTGKGVVDGQTSGLTNIPQSDHLFASVPFLRDFYIQNFSDKWTLSYSPGAFSETPSANDLSLLKGWGITYLVLHKTLYSSIGGTSNATGLLSSLTRIGWLSEVYEDESIIIYRITVAGPINGSSQVPFQPGPSRPLLSVPGEWALYAWPAVFAAVAGLRIRLRRRPWGPEPPKARRRDEGASAPEGPLSS